MADQHSNGKTPPPKIRLGGEPPPVAPVGKRKSDTSRVDLSATQPTEVRATGGEPLNIRDVLGRKADEKSSTSRIPLSETQSVPSGAQVPVAKAKTGPVESKSATLRVTVPEGAGDETARVVLRESQRLTPEEEAEMDKSSTVRVDLTGLVSPDQLEADDTSIMASPELDRVRADASKNRTARISIDLHSDETQAIPGEEIPTGAPVGAPAEKPPKTVRMNRPSAAPRTIVLKRPEPAGQTPKTVVLKRPDEHIEEKGATARIAVPEAAFEPAPSSQRKTIRIKRSDGAGAAAPAGAGAKELRIARPAPASALAPDEGEIQVAIGAKPADRMEPGVFFTVLAIAATLVLGVLVYVLLAQTYFIDWDFYGKIL
jgi:hypothetical protein